MLFACKPTCKQKQSLAYGNRQRWDFFHAFSQVIENTKRSHIVVDVYSFWTE